MAANVAVFVLMLGAGAGFVTPHAQVHLAWGANYGPATKDGEWWRLFTSMFLHFGVIHLAFNMWALADAGRLVERLFGAAAFLAAYLFAGLTGSLASLLWHADGVVSAGASGAVFGIYGALFAFLFVERGSVPLSALKRLATSGALFVGYALIAGAMVPGIDNACHLGGLFGGCAAGLALSRPLEAGARLSGRRVGVPRRPASRCSPPCGCRFRRQVTRIARSFPPSAPSTTLRAGKSSSAVARRRSSRLGSAGSSATCRPRSASSGSWCCPGLRRKSAWPRSSCSPAAPAGRALELLKRYAAGRHDMYALFAEGLRDGDRAKLRQADQRADEVKRLLAELKALQKGRK